MSAPVRARRSVALRPVTLALLLLAPLGCGRGDAADEAEHWPLTVAEPGVLGYVAFSLPEAQLEELLAHDLGWNVAGIASDRPFVLLRLETATYGGPVAALVPLDDEAAFSASLAAAEGIESLGDSRYRFRIPFESPLGLAWLALSGLTADITSPADILSALRRSADNEFSLRITTEGGRALAVPSFEAEQVCRGVEGHLSGPPPGDLVLSVDLARIQQVYAEQIRAADQQLQALLSGARLGGLMGGLGGEEAFHLPLNWEVIWAVREMLGLEQLDALQLRVGLRPPAPSAAGADDPTGGDSGFDPSSAFDQVEGLGLELRVAESSPLKPLIDSMRPVSDPGGPGLALAADPERFADAFAAWCRPLAEVVKGEGPPCDRYVNELAALLGDWDGRLSLVPVEPEGLALLLSARGSEGTLQRWSDWLKPLLATARIEGFENASGFEQEADGRLVLRGADGDALCTARRDGDVFWLAPGSSDGPPAELLDDFRSARTPETGPALRASFEGFALDVTGVGRRLSLQLSLPPDRP